jgi:hypothetical protein
MRIEGSPGRYACFAGSLVSSGACTDHGGNTTVASQKEAIVEGTPRGSAHMRCMANAGIDAFDHKYQVQESLTWNQYPQRTLDDEEHFSPLHGHKTGRDCGCASNDTSQTKSALSLVPMMAEDSGAGRHGGSDNNTNEVPGWQPADAL